MLLRAVGFDYLGVLTRLGGGRSIYQRIAEVAGVAPDDVYAAYQRHNRALQTGELSVAELWTLIASELGVSGRATAMIATADDTVPELNPDMLNLAGRLKRGGYRVGLLSNLSGSWVDHLRTLGIDQLFDAALFSSETQLAKPDPRAFQLLADRLGVDPHELVFIDDQTACLEGVDRLGVTPILFTGYDKLVTDLKKLGVTGTQTDH